MEEKKQKILNNIWIRLIIFLCLAALFFVICGLLKGILISLFLAFTVAYILDPVVDFIEARKKILPGMKIGRSIAICILLLSITFISCGLLSYAIPKTVSGIQQVGFTIKQQFPEFRSIIIKIIESYGNNEVSIFLKNKLGIENNKETLVDDELDVGKKTTGETNQEYIVFDKPDGDKGNFESQIGLPWKIRGVGDKPDGDKGNVETASDEKHMLAPLYNLKKYVPQVLQFASNIATTIFKNTFGLFGIVINFFIFGVVMVYLLKDFDLITAKVRDLIPRSRRDKVGDIFFKIDINLKEFFRGQITVCLILSFIYSIGLTIVGVPLSFVLGFAAGFGNIIPYVGTIVGLGLAMVITFFQFHDVQHLVFVGMVFGIGQLLEGVLITPRIIGSKLGLSPVIVIVSILIWSQLLGFLGLLLAVPFTSAAKVLIDEGIVRYKGSSIYKKGNPETKETYRN